MPRAPLPTPGQATQVLARLHHEDRGAVRMDSVFITIALVALVVVIVAVVVLVVT